MTDDELLRRPIIVLGAPRSGTTLLSHLLKEHPAVYLANEPRIMWKYGNDAKSDCLQAADARPDVVKYIRGTLAGHLRSGGRTRLVEKTPSNSLRLEFVERVLPDAIYLHIMRDGIESVLSIRKYSQQHATGIAGNTRKVLWRRLREMQWRQFPHYAGEFARRVGGKFSSGDKPRAVWGPRIPGIAEMVRDLDPLQVAAWQWRMCVEHTSRVGRTLPPDRYTEIRLEEFDEQELGRLMKFCDLEPSDEVSASFAKKFQAQPATARSDQTDAEEVERVRQLIEPTTSWLATLQPLARHRGADGSE